MRILIADDDSQVRFALRVLLQQRLGLEVVVVGEAADTNSLQEQVSAKEPDVLLIDWELPGLSPNGSFAALRRTRPQLVVIGMSSRLEARRAALAAGADGFVSKSDAPEYLLKAIGEACRH
jgi:DNA-binding NarL/FixJ family response regulator